MAKRIPDDPSLADPVAHDEFQRELARLRAAITLLANSLGANMLSQHDAKRLMELLAPPHERT